MQNTQNQPIWNPSRVASLSFVLTPAFGSYLQASNWRTLGQPERAVTSKIWFYISLIVLAAMAAGTVGLVGRAAADNDAIRGLINIGGLIYFFLWYAVSGRHQVRYVKDSLGKTYAKKSLTKPILIALGLGVLYALAIFGLLVATHGSGDADTGTPDQASSTGSSFSLASLIGGNHGLDCAAPNVKTYIAETYGKQLVETGIPDLVWAVRDNRIKIHVDAIHETAWNNESKNIDCAGNFVIDFPRDDIEHAVEAQQHVFVMQASATLTDPTFIAPITYQVATPSDADERKLGPIVTLTTQEDAAVDNHLRTYAADYQALAYATPDITPTSANSTPWDKAFKDATIQACSKSADVGRCTCRLNDMERFIGEQQMARIGYTLQNAGPLSGNRFPNFKKLADALGQQCPLTQNLAAVLGDQAAAADVPASSVEDGTVPASEAAQPAQAAIVASFDCGKASSKIEKLVCSSPATADADRRLAFAYRAAAAKASDVAALKQQQRDWLKERNACDDAACLIKATEARIQVLSTM
ncbi:lysozyme inhibitor LprI family protein [Paraburkholderia atlantica]|uniref:lysozyme inhibitor LprI family protein n=1 Tax=Paraburkholderia atlantica TaxID=2654982 RepID=UPI00160C077E|nr:lysozyme inhibitor LprI family protein [Paraburkholderia atlantica]MBB5508728.1 uncharacterized protein YecT (DUF1311 family) [Paraburkholderia atlantica]